MGGCICLRGVKLVLPGACNYRRRVPHVLFDDAWAVRGFSVAADILEPLVQLFADGGVGVVHQRCKCSRGGS